MSSPAVTRSRVSQPRRPHRLHRLRRLALATTAPLIVASLAGFAARPASAQTYGALTTLVTFSGGINGRGSQGDLTFDSSGNLYGTTAFGGFSDNGTVYKFAPGSNTFTTLASFAGGVGGANPAGNVVFDSGGNLYGVASGGSSNDGVIFRIAAGTNTISVAANFLGGGSGISPAGNIAIDSSGNLYGATTGGGANSDGTVFSLAPGSLTINTIASLTTASGTLPFGGVILDGSGNVYATTSAGGSGSDGTVFKIASGTNTPTTLVNFSGTNNGSDPESSLIIDSSGNLYGTTRTGGASNRGSVFKIAAGTNTLTTLVSFNNANGSVPDCSLTLDSSGNLYGTTQFGGTNNLGTVFKITAGTNALTTLATFTGTNGQYPRADVVLDSGGNIYGTTVQGGANSDGTLFKIAASAYTDTYTGNGGFVASSAPVSGNFSNGFFTTLGMGTAGTTLSFAGTSYTATDDLTVAATVNSLSFSNSGAVTLARGGAGTTNQLVFATNATTGAAPTLVLGNSGAVTIAPDLALNANTTVSGSGSATIIGIVSGAGGLTKSGAGTLTLSGSNTNTGAWTVSGGTLALVGGSDVSSIAVASGATLALSGGVQYTIGGGSGTLRANSGGTVTYNNATVNGGTIVGAGTQTIASGGATFNNVNVNTTSALTQSGALTMNSGTLQSALTNNAALTYSDGLVTSKGSVTVASGVTDAFSNVEVDGKLTIPNGATVNNSGASLVLGGGSQTNIGTKTTSGGTLALGGQTLELNGAFLSNNGTISGGVVNINYGSTAKGAGNYAGGYSVNYGGKIIFGNSPGTLRSGAATWNGGSSLAFQIDDATGAAGVGWGDSVVDGALSLNASPSSKITIALTSLLPSGDDDAVGPLAYWDPSHNYSWDYVTASGGITGFDPSLFALDTTGFTAYNATNGGKFSLSESPDSQTLSVIFNAAAPEPGSLALLLVPGVATAFGIGLRRRQRMVR